MLPFEVIICDHIYLSEPKLNNNPIKSYYILNAKVKISIGLIVVLFLLLVVCVAIIIFISSG